MGTANYLHLTKANQNHFSLEVTGLPSELLQVLSFHSEHDGLCEDFYFDIEMQSAEPINAGHVIGKDITLTTVWGTENRTISGIGSYFIAHGQSHQGFHYTVRLASFLTLLKHSHSNRIFTDMTPAAIVRTVLQKAGFPMAILQMQAQGPQLDMVVQYDEDDYQFVTRLMRRYGFVYGFVEQNEGRAQFVVCENSADFAAKFDAIDLSYVAPSGQVRISETIFAFSEKATLHCNSVSYNDYNYEAPADLTLNSQSQSKTPGAGSDSRYGENYKATGAGKALADVRMTSLDSMRHQLIIDSDCRALRPGVILNVYDHDSYNGRYLVVAVEHKGDQGAGVEYGNHVKGLTYKNQARILPIGQDFKAPLLPQRRAFATFSAFIEQEIDDKGRYIVKLPFNQDGEGQESRPTRLMQPYGGSGHGMHFPLTAGTEVLVCGENGDLDRPIILGALYNQNTPNPVTSANAHQNKLVTKAGHSLVMDDQNGQEHIELATDGSQNSLKLDATDGAHMARLQSLDGEIHVQAKHAVSFKAGEDMVADAGNDIKLQAQNQIQMQTRENDISLTAAGDIQATSDANIRLQANDGGIDIKADQHIQFQAEQDTTLLSSNGNIHAQTDTGNIELASGNNITLVGTGQGSIQLSQGGGSIEIDAAGNLTIDAQNITLSAANITVKGNAISDN